MKKAFTDVFRDCSRFGTKLPTSEYQQAGRNPIIDQGQAAIAGYTDLENGVFRDIPAIIFGDHTRIVKYVDQPFFMGADGVKILKAIDSDVDYRYLYYALRFVNIPNTGYNRHYRLLKESFVTIEGLPRQREIVHVLDKVEAVIDKHKRQLAKLDELVKARFVEMFGSTVANEKKWSTQKIETVAPARCATQKQQTTVWLLNLDAVESHTGRILEYQYVDYTRVGPSTCCFDEKNVLYSKLRPYLNKVVLPDRPGMATSELVPLRPNDQVNRVFLAYMLRSDEFVAYIKEKVSGAKMPRVQMDEFRKFPMIIPPLPLQRQFAEFVTHTEKMKGKVRASLEATQKLLGSLMQEYFS
ncbi:MAG: hypothetical protein ACI4OX_07700 [Akkermansia sp.]